jgi:hypothetical protein
MIDSMICMIDRLCKIKDRKFLKVVLPPARLAVRGARRWSHRSTTALLSLRNRTIPQNPIVSSSCLPRLVCSSMTRHRHYTVTDHRAT